MGIMEVYLIRGETIQVIIDEQNIFNQLGEDEDLIWNLMLASGYLKVDNVQYQDEFEEEKYSGSGKEMLICVLYLKKLEWKEE